MYPRETTPSSSGSSETVERGDRKTEENPHARWRSESVSEPHGDP